MGDEEREIKKKWMKLKWMKWRRQGKKREIIDKRRPVKEEKPPDSQISPITDSNI